MTHGKPLSKVINVEEKILIKLRLKISSVCRTFTLGRHKVATGMSCPSLALDQKSFHNLVGESNPRPLRFSLPFHPTSICYYLHWGDEVLCLSRHHLTTTRTRLRCCMLCLAFSTTWLLTCYSSASNIINLAKKKKKVDTVSNILSQLGRKCSKVEKMTSVLSHKTSLIADSAWEWWVRPLGL